MSWSLKVRAELFKNKPNNSTGGPMAYRRRNWKGHARCSVGICGKPLKRLWEGEREMEREIIGLGVRGLQKGHGKLN